MNKGDKALQIGIETLITVRKQASIIPAARTRDDTMYILQEIDKELKIAINQIDILIGENNE